MTSYCRTLLKLQPYVSASAKKNCYAKTFSHYDFTDLFMYVVYSEAPEKVTVCSSLQDALDVLAKKDNVDKIFVIGGAAVYKVYKRHLISLM